MLLSGGEVSEECPIRHHPNRTAPAIYLQNRMSRLRQKVFYLFILTRSNLAMHLYYNA